MSIRRQLYDQLSKVPGGDPVVRIMAISQLLDGMPPEKVAATERWMLALAIAMTPGSDALADPKATADDFFAKVDAIERQLTN